MECREGGAVVLGGILVRYGAKPDRGGEVLRDVGRERERRRRRDGG
jgi:hypothetical protein